MKAPSVMRYDRVASILGAEPAFKDRIGPKDQVITKRNSEKFYYSRLVVSVTDLIHTHGLDAHNVPKSYVLKVATEACDFLSQNGAPVKPPVKRKKTEPPVKTEEAAKEMAAKKKAPEPKVPQPETAVVVAEAPKPAEPYRSQAPAPQVLEAESKLVTVYSNIAKLTLCISVQNLMQLDDDKFPGFEKRSEAINFLIGDFNRIKNSPTMVELRPDAKS